VFVAAPTGAGDLNWKLRGDYTYNIAGTCARAGCSPDQAGKYDCQSESTRGFNPATLALRVPASQKSDSYKVQSVVHFDGHEKFTLKGEGLSIRLSPGTAPPDIPANQFDLNCDGTYKVNSDGNGLFVDITFTKCTSMIKSGFFGQLGFTQEISGPTTLRGRLDTSTESSPVTISNTIPYIEEMEVTYVLSPFDFLIGSKEQRICNNMGSIVKLSPRKNWFSK